MALDRWKLREDLVTVIAAGRELAPENDYALAEVFLQHAREALIREVAPPQPTVKPGHIAALIGAGCLALASLMSPFLLFHHHDGRPAFNQSVMVPGGHDHHRFDQQGWWNGDGR